jgi:putative colanic acid biosynthesis acetyltransferase WcaF
MNGRHAQHDAAPKRSGPDVTPHRHSPHSLGNRAGRLLWALVSVLLFRFSPRNLHWWRNMLLRAFGARMHSRARVYPRARIWAPWNLVMEEGATIGDDVNVYNVARIHLQAWAGVSQYCFLCSASHDFEDVRFPLAPAPITLGRRVWLAADVFVAPGVTIGEGTVVGARSSVFSDLDPWIVAMGTPARRVRQRSLGPADYGEPPTGTVDDSA